MKFCNIYRTIIVFILLIIGVKDVTAKYCNFAKNEEDG